MDEDATRNEVAGDPASPSDRSHSATEDQHAGQARRPSDRLDKDRESEETVPRKSSLL